MKRITHWHTLTTLLIFCLVAACGGGDIDVYQNATLNIPIGGETGRELAESQVLHWGNGAEPQSLDPHKSQGTPGSNIQRELFEGLINEAPSGEIIPGAAQSWEISDDGKTYTFYLRPNARWSNGDAVTAEDFVYSLRRSLDPATLSRYTFILNPIVNAREIAAGQRSVAELGVRAIDALTLEIELENSTVYFLGLLTHSSTYPVHRDSIEAYGERHTRPGNLVSNGAFQLDDWVVQSHIKVVRNPYYWGNGETILEEVYFHNTEDNSAEIRRYRADEIDITYATIARRQLPWIRENIPDELTIAPYLGTAYYGFNLTRPPFKDNPELRRALTLAIDRDIITQQVTTSGEISAYGWVPPVAGYVGQQMPEASWTQAEREDEARRLYALAGYSDENPLLTEIMYNTSEDHKRIALAISAMWKQVLGVEVSILNQEWKVFLDTRKQMTDTQVFRDAWIGDYNDAFTFAELYQSASGLNTSGWANERYDQLLNRGATESDPVQRAEYLQEAERILLDELPILPIYFYVTVRLVKPWVGGFSSNMMDHHRSKDYYILKH
jgi:oligopeptide transport system substrate-binding protein